MKKALVAGVALAFTGAGATGQPSPRILELLEQPAAQRYVTEGRPTRVQTDDWELIFGWARQPFQRTPEARQALWPAVKRIAEEPICAEVLKDLPDDPEVDAFFSSQLSRLPYRAQVRVWLRRRGRFLRPDLIRAALQAQEEDLRILARLDPRAAQKVLDRLRTQSAHRMLVLAVEAQMQPGRSDLRRPLEAAGLNPRVSDQQRQLACRTLSRISWPGQLPFMHRLWSLSGDSYLLEEWVKADPDRWVPAMKDWLKDANSHVHNHAVQALVQFHGENHREDALRALLPWLSHPGWSNSRDRLRLIQSLDRFECPEAIPGLIQIVSQPGDESERSYAALTLAHYRDPRAIPAIRGAFLQQASSYDRERYLQALVACGAYPPEVQAQAVELYAQLLLRYGDKARYGDDLLEGDETTALGAFLGRSENELVLSSQLVQALGRRIASLRKENPALARKLEEVLCDWPGPAVDAYLQEQVVSDQADATLLAQAWGRRARLDANVLRTGLQTARGEQAGILAALLGQSGDWLDGRNPATANAFLAMGRLGRLPLPAESVKLRHQDPLTQRAADEYLVALDSPEARALLPGRIFGSSGGELKKITPQLEKQLQERLQSHPELDEIFALFTTGYYESYGHFFVFRSGDDVVLRWAGGGSNLRERPLSAGEWRQFQSFVQNRQVDFWPKLNEVAGHSAEYQYFHLTRQNGARVYCWSPQPRAEQKQYWELTQLFKKLLSGPMLLRHPAVEANPGARLIFDSAVHHLEAVSVFGDLAGPAVKLTPSMQLDPSMLRSQAFQRFGLSPGGGAWYDLKWQKRPAPQGLLQDDTSDLPKQDAYENGPVWMSQTPQGRVRALSTQGYRGLYMTSPGRKPRKLAEGWFARPVASDDGRWVVVPRADGDWSKPNPLIRIELKTGKVDTIAIEAADNLDCLAYIPQRGFLARSVRDASDGLNPKSRGPAQPAYFLIDPDSAAVTPVTGEFAPLSDLAHRPLQPTGQPGEYYAARAHNDGTEVGTYCFRTFAFHSLRHYPKLHAGSSQIWVDPKNKKLYVCTEGNILEFSGP